MPGRSLHGFPRIRLDAPKRVVVRVRDLPEPMVPSWANLRIEDGELSPLVRTQPWRQVCLRFSLRRRDGTLAYAKVYDLSRDWNGAGEYASRRNQWISLRIWKEREALAGQDIKDYDFIIEVLRPSARPADELQIEGAFSPFGLPVTPPVPLPRPPAPEPSPARPTLSASGKRLSSKATPFELKSHPF